METLRILSQGRAWKRFWRRGATRIGLVLILMRAAAALAGPYLAPYDPLKTNAASLLAGPAPDHLLGTDSLGRDILSRILYGAAVSSQVGLVAVVIAAVIGIPLGIISGYYRGWIDLVLMRLVDIFLAFPVILLALAIIGVLGPSISNLMIAIGVVSWTRYARVSRAEVLALREREFILAEQSVGAPAWRIMLFHLFPNMLSSLVVIATYGIASAILWEAGLSFLGLGVQPPNPSWGNILNEGRAYMKSAPWVATFPGLAIMLAVLGFNLLGDGLRDALDPRLAD